MWAARPQGRIWPPLAAFCAGGRFSQLLLECACGGISAFRALGKAVGGQMRGSDRALDVEHYSNTTESPSKNKGLP